MRKRGYALNRAYYLLLLFLDFVILAASIGIAVLMRFGTLDTQEAPFSAMLGTWVFFAVAMQLFSLIENLYAVRTTVNRTMNVFRTIRLILISVIIYVMLMFLTHFPEDTFISSRMVMLNFMLTWLVLSVLFRILIAPMIFGRAAKLFGFGPIRVLVFGRPLMTRKISDLLRNSPVYRRVLETVRVECALEDDPDERFAQCMGHMEEEDGDEFVMVFEEDEEIDFIAPFALAARRRGMPFTIYSPRITPLGYFDPWLTWRNFGALTFFSREWSPLTRRFWRLADILLAFLGLIVFSPLFLLITLAIILDSRGGVLFRQRRIGKDEEPFEFLKFRSMRVEHEDRERNHREYFERYVNGDAAGEDESGEAVYKSVASSAVTPVGRIIRKTSLDELPQFINVLRGEMSIVGPRPCIDYELKYYDREWLRQRFTVKPGLTGIWQVYARSRLDFRRAQFLDFVYVLSRSDGVNLRLILKTVPVMLLGRGGV